MTAIPISIQQVGGSIPFPFTTSITITISAVDLTKTYVFAQGHESGRILCISCPGAPGGGKPADDGHGNQFAYELLTSTSIRIFRSAAAPAPDCRALVRIAIVEYL